MSYQVRLTVTLLCAATVQTAQAAEPATLDEVVVVAAREPSTEPTKQTQRLLSVPGSFDDPLQAIYSLPGVVQTNDQGGQPAVRGSGPDDNAYLVDDLPVGFVFHDFGNSIFQESLIQDFGLTAAGYSARFGGATGALFDVKLRDPRSGPLVYTGELGVLRAGALVEGGIGDNQAFYLSYRESLYHLYLKAQADEQKKTDDTAFKEYPRSNDFQGKYVWHIGEHQQLSVLALSAQDRAALDFGNKSAEALVDPGTTGVSSINTRFHSVGINWRYENGADRIDLALGRLSYSRLDQRGSGREYADINTDNDTFRGSYSRALSSRNTLTAGLELHSDNDRYKVNSRYRSCSTFSPECATDPGKLVVASGRQTLRTEAAYLEDQYTVHKDLLLTAGVRYARNDYLKESHVEPRLAAKWTLDPLWSVHASWGQYHQSPQIPELLPVFGNPKLKSPTASHYVLGMGTAEGQRYSFNLDLYYKSLDKLVQDVSDGTQYQNLAHGQAYGAEFLGRLDRVTADDRLTGWVSLSLSRTRRYDGLTKVTVPFDFDTPVVANVVANYQINPRWSAGMRWNYRSGYPYTPIIGNTENRDYPGYYLPIYGELNSQRSGPYHRLDLRVERQLQWGDVHGSYFLDIINAYGAANGGSVVYKAVPGSRDYKLEKQEALPFFPAIGFKVTF